VWSVECGHIKWSHVKKRPPNHSEFVYLPVTGGHCGPNGKRACFFPVIFQSFESLSVVTDRQTDRRINPFGGQLGTTKVAPCLRNEFLSVQHDSGLKMFVSLKASSLCTPQKFTQHDSFIIHF
jgi:hypothetical protein